jgi:hypothetical protein
MIASRCRSGDVEQLQWVGSRFGFDASAFLAEWPAPAPGSWADSAPTVVPRFGPRLGDGSYLSVLGTVPVRIVEAKITVTCKDGASFTGSYSFATTSADARRFRASTLVTLYHQRREHESAYHALRHTLWQGRVLRSGGPFGVEHEMWAMLTIYQALRTVMAEASESRPGTAPDRRGFTIAFHTARDLVL